MLESTLFFIMECGKRGQSVCQGEYTLLKCKAMRAHCKLNYYRVQFQGGQKEEATQRQGAGGAPKCANNLVDEANALNRGACRCCHRRRAPPRILTLALAQSYPPHAQPDAAAVDRAALPPEEPRDESTIRSPEKQHTYRCSIPPHPPRAPPSNQASLPHRTAAAATMSSKVRRVAERVSIGAGRR